MRFSTIVITEDHRSYYKWGKEHFPFLLYLKCRKIVSTWNQLTFIIHWPKELYFLLLFSLPSNVAQMLPSQLIVLLKIATLYSLLTLFFMAFTTSNLLYNLPFYIFIAYVYKQECKLHKDRLFFPADYISNT